MVTEKDLSLPPDRPDRHPYVVCVMAGLLFATVFFTVGLVAGWLKPINHTPYAEAYSVIGCLFVGSALTLVGAWLPRERDIRLSLEVGILGQFTICASMCYLAANLIADQANPRPFAYIIMIALAVAALWRIFQMLFKLKVIRAYVEAHRERNDPGAD